MITVDPAPLLAALGDLDDHGAAALLGVTSRTLIRWRSGHARIGSIERADQLAVALGLHPASIWPDYWSWPLDPQEALPLEEVC